MDYFLTISSISHVKRQAHPTSSSPTAPELSNGPSQTDLAYEQLREAIISLVLQPGEMYSEAHLATFTKLGRTPVREALQRLIREELVTPRRNRGIQITQIDIIRHLQLLDVRRSLERLLAERASKHATHDERQAMLQLADATDAAIARGDSKNLLNLSSQAQDMKTQAAHNDILNSTMDLFFGLSRRFWFAYASQIEGSQHTASSLHAKILRLIAVSDVDAATRATNELMDFLEQFTRRTIELKTRT